MNKHGEVKSIPIEEYDGPKRSLELEEFYKNMRHSEFMYKIPFKNSKRSHWMHPTKKFNKHIAKKELELKKWLGDALDKVKSIEYEQTRQEFESQFAKSDWNSAFDQDKDFIYANMGWD